jgi:hypothetical protein
MPGAHEVFLAAGMILMGPGIILQFREMPADESLFGLTGRKRQGLVLSMGLLLILLGVLVLVSYLFGRLG